MRKNVRLGVGMMVFAAIIAIMSVMLPLSAQTTGTPTVTPTPTPNPGANISYPPPVYLVRGQFPLRGTANLPGLTNYFIEYRLLETSLVGAPGVGVFFPVFLPSTVAVTDEQLGTWDTSFLPDGVYELRLTVNVTGQTQPIQQIVGPIRVENNPPPFAPTAQPTAAPDVQPVGPTGEPPTVPPPPTIVPTEDTSPRVTVTSAAQANVRSGDGTNYPIIAGLPPGSVAPVVGISNLGTGWYQIRLTNGSVGWISPTVVEFLGALNVVPRVAPPPPPATPTFTPIPATLTPIFTPLPASNVNFVAGNITVNPFPPRCGQPYTVGFDIANFGTVASLGGTVNLVDARAADGQLPISSSQNFPAIQPGQTINVQFPNLVNSVFVNELHRITVTIDASNLLVESNEGDNVRTLEYTLGAC